MGAAAGNVEEQAQELFDRLMKQRVEREGIAEKLKAERPMLWVGRMNALLAYRNKLIAQGRYTDAVNEVMIKLRK